MLFWANFLIRALSVGILGYIFIRQLVNIIQHPATNGLAATRRALIILTVGISIEYIVRLAGDIHELIVGIPTQTFLGDVQVILLIARLITLAAIVRFSLLLLHGKKSASDESDSGQDSRS